MGKSIFLLAMFVISALASVRPTKPVNIPVVNAVYSKPWYSGYLDLENGNTHMHYFYFPSQRPEASTDPLLFWFNGGPGCSSLLGALYEHGPFLINDAFGTYMNNPFAWNLKANVVYIQSPAQVGFSYMDAPAPTWNDEMVAQLNLKAVLEFVRTWPEFAHRPTFLAGESYAGIYVPTLFQAIHDFNEKASDSDKVNLIGFAVGNGCTDPLECEFQNDYPVFLMKLYLDLGFISPQLYAETDKKCANQGRNLTQECQDILEKVDDMQNGINIYDAYRPCYQNQIKNQNLPSSAEMRRLALRKRSKPTDTLTWAPPCVDSLGIDALLLAPQNRKQLGIPDKVAPYSMCNADGSFSYDRSLTGSYNIYKRLVPLNKYKITVYSGDSDPAVPFAGTIYWMQKLRTELKLSTVQYWRPWFTTTTNGKQNSGNVWSLRNSLKLVTFKGIGHMAPQWNYEGGFKMIDNLLHGTPL